MPEFQISKENFPDLISICRRLDGMPLALELAAARVNVLSVAQISARLDDRFRLLTGGSRTALPRQQTLRALIDWSWDLLEEPEKILLRRLSVFAGSMVLEAVEAVCAGDGIDAYDLLDILSGLVNKSLVISHRQQGQETRYRLLETIRQYAQEQLMVTGCGGRYHDRHLEYFQQLALKIEQELVQSEQLLWHHKLNREADNFRMAMNWALETNVEAGLRLISAIWRNWMFGRSREGEAWLAKYFAHAENVAPRIKAKTYFEKSIHSFSKMDGVDGIIYAVEGFASMALNHQQPELATQLFSWSDATRTANQDPRPPVEQADVGLDKALIIDMIGKEAYRTAYAEGKGMTTEQAIAAAMALDVG